MWRRRAAGRTTLTARASHIIEARGTLGLFFQKIRIVKIARPIAPVVAVGSVFIPCQLTSGQNIVTAFPGEFISKRNQFSLPWREGSRYHWRMSSMVYRACVGIIFALVSSVSAQEALTSVKSVRDLTSTQAAQRRLVEVEGTVTYAMLPSGFFIHDQTEGVYVSIPTVIQTNMVLHAGDRVRLKATTDPGEYFPRLLCLSVTNEGSVVLPQTTPVTPENLFSPELDCQWVKITGVIVHAEMDPIDQLVMTLELYGWTFKVVMQSSEANIADVQALMMQKVTFEGVAATVFNQQRQTTGRFFYVPSLKFIHAVDEHQGTHAPVTLAVADLLRSDTASASMVRVGGIVTYAAKNELCLRGEGGSLRVLLAGGKTNQLGDHVEVVGYATIAPFRPVVRAREVITLRSGEPPEPVDMVMAMTNLPSLQAELVKVPNAVYLGAQENPEGMVMHCQVQNLFFEAILPKPFALPSALVPGCSINIVGTCELTTSHAVALPTRVDGFRLHLTSPHDLIIVSRPSWWTPQRSLAVLAVAAGFGILAVSWIWILRRQVVAQTKIIGGQIQREATLHERHRIARELHDSIEQEMAGVAIQISNARRRLDQNPTQADSALTLAQEMIRHCRAEARTSIRDLRSVALEQGGLPLAIKEVLTPAATAANIKLDLTVKGSVVRLDARLESDLLRVAQEAVANAIHHASPSKIEITLDYASDFVTLTVQDDGCGFDASSVPPRGHFGLLGMQERAKQQHARLIIESRPGAGTKVSLLTPTSSASNSGPKES